MGQRRKAIVVLAIIIGAAWLYSEVNKSKDPNACGSKTMAFVISQEFVKKHLKAPATASFPWGTNSDGVSVVERGRCEYTVNAYVDAENSFGAKLRTQYRADVTYMPEGNSWQLNDISM